MSVLPSKCSLKRQAVADLLYEVLFVMTVDNMAKWLGKELIDKSLLNTPKIKLEWSSLIAFLVTFSFQREFIYLGQETTNSILDYFHDKLFKNINKTFKNSSRFSDELKNCYSEYYPIMKEDLECLGIEDTIVFRGLTEAFFSKIAPDKLKSKESLLFGLSLADLYFSMCKTYDKIKKYKIV